MPFCAVLKCKNRSGLQNIARGGVTYHRFPHDPGVKAGWISATGRPNYWIPSKTSTICSVHFEQHDFITKNGGRHYVHHTAVPSRNVDRLYDTVPSHKEAHSRDAVVPRNIFLQKNMLPSNIQGPVYHNVPQPQGSGIPCFMDSSQSELKMLHQLNGSDSIHSGTNWIEVEVMPENETNSHHQTTNNTSLLIPDDTQNNFETKDEDKRVIDLLLAKIQDQDLLIRKLKLRNYRLKRRLFSLKSMET